MTSADKTRLLTLCLWTAVASSLLCWRAVGYPWPVCLFAAVPLLAPLYGLIRGDRRTYAWGTLVAIPYLMLALTEILVNPAARWAAGSSLFLVFAWFCSMVLFLRASTAHPE